MPTNEHPNPNQWWFHRRLMAYTCLTAIIVSLICALTGKIPEPMLPLVEGLCWILGFIVAAYYTNNAAEAFAKVRK